MNPITGNRKVEKNIKPFYKNLNEYLEDKNIKWRYYATHKVDTVRLWQEIESGMD